MLRQNFGVINKEHYDGVMVVSGVVNWVSSVRTLHKPTILEGFFAAAKVALLTAMILFAFKTLLNKY